MNVGARVRELIDTINRHWQTGSPKAIADLVADAVVMEVPALGVRIQGQPAFIAGFEDFTANARVIEYSEKDWQIDAFTHCALASFRFEMIYERDGARYRSSGRDLWLCELREDRWLAVWRAMLDLAETPAV